MDFKAVLAGYVQAFNSGDMDADSEKRFIPNSKALEWMLENVPLIDLPDKVIERAYYFRWWSFRKHIRKTEDGFVISEFLKDVPWAGKHNTISCAAGHHIYEGRWIKDPKYLDDYINFWLNGGGSLRSYSFWAADSVYKRYLVNGDIGLIERHFAALATNYSAWEQEHGDENGLFWQIDDREGMELSMAGAGHRPNINSYMYADARALSEMAALLGLCDIAKDFDKKAKNIKTLMLKTLWDKEAQFFKTYVSEKHQQIQLNSYKNNTTDAYTNQPLGLSPVEELYGYTPWYYGVMDDVSDSEYQQAWRFIVDPDYFAGPAGLATAPIKHPDFQRFHHHECAWDGPSWPYATCQALGAMAKLLRNNDKTPVSTKDYMNLVHQYAAAHKLGERDWIDENFDPITGEWLARKRLYEWDDPNKDRGQYYNHSSFCDLVISDVIGLQVNADGFYVKPLATDFPYFALIGVNVQGRVIDIYYDKDGSRYGKGAGLNLFSN